MSFHQGKLGSPSSLGFTAMTPYGEQIQTIPTSHHSLSIYSYYLQAPDMLSNLELALDVENLAAQSVHRHFILNNGTTDQMLESRRKQTLAIDPIGPRETSHASHLLSTPPTRLETAALSPIASRVWSRPSWAPLICHTSVSLFTKLLQF